MKKLISIIFVLLLLSFSAVYCFANEDAEILSFGDFNYILLEDGTAKITKYLGTQTDLYVPEKINDIIVTSIGDKAFDSCGITSVTIPDAVTNIGDNPFSNCKSLEKIYLSSNHPTLSFKEGALFSKTENRLITYLITKINPWYIIPQGTKVIGSGAFLSCENIKRITIPDSVLTIGNEAFCACVNLTDISIPDSVISIGESAFGACLYLPSITIPDSVTYIGDSAFSFCMSLSDIQLSNNITSIGDDTFYECEFLTSLTIPNSVTSIEGGAFSYCKKLTNIVLSPDHPTLKITDGVLINKAENRLIWYPCSLPASEYQIPEGINIISDCAFLGCNNLTSITIPDSVTTIEDNAFRYCRNLSNAEMPFNLTSIGEFAFDGCDNLTINYRFEDYLYLLQEDGTIKISKYLGSERELTIPSVLNQLKVTAIGDWAFENCNDLISITIPDCVISVGSNPFCLCDALNKIYVSPDHTTLAIIDGVLFSKPDKRLISYPLTFSNDKYSIPQGIQIIGSGAFFFCDKLKSVTIPNSVNSIEDGAFSCCFSLMDLTIPDSIVHIGDSAFEYCSNLTEVKIPSSVISIGNRVFQECSNLQSITIPDSVTTIGENTFEGCDNLNSIVVGRDSFARQYCIDNDLSYTYSDANDWLLN